VVEAPKTCTDGTSYGSCSSTKPKYCNEGVLIDGCSQCGCLGEDECQPDGSCESVIVTEYLGLQEGWNMLSITTDTPIDASNLLRDCSAETSLYQYDPAADAYIKVTVAQPGLGYWVRLYSACQARLIGEPITIADFPEIKQGKNLIGSLAEPTNFDDMRGNCNVISGPVKYNPTTRGYESVTVLEPGFAYWLNVVNDCNLG
jgi:hypothetical protein